MTREELWSELVNKHPSFGGDGQVTLGAAGLRRLFDLIVWGRGRKPSLKAVEPQGRD